MQTNSIRFALASVQLCFFLVSCGPPPPKSGLPPIAELPSTSSTSTASSTSSASTNTSLPERAEVDWLGLRLLESTFRTQLNINRLDDLYATTRREVQHLSIISNCDLNVLKAFVAKGWAPIVLAQYGNKRHLWAVMGYNYVTGVHHIQLGNPVTRAARSIAADDFEKEWGAGSALKCVLITPGLLREEKVKSVLEEYGLSNQVARISVRSR